MTGEHVKKVSMYEKSGYASGDLACNLIYTTVSTYLLFFIRMFTVCQPPLPEQCF